jgi:hypothetical protein
MVRKTRTGNEDRKKIGKGRDKPRTFSRYHYRERRRV